MKLGVDAYHKEVFTDDEDPMSLSCSRHVHKNFETTYRRMLKNPANWGKIYVTFHYLQLWGHEMYRDVVWKAVKEYWESLGEGHVGNAFGNQHMDKHGKWRYGVVPYSRPLDNQALECNNHHLIKEPLRNDQRASAAAVDAAVDAANDASTAT